MNIFKRFRRWLIDTYIPAYARAAGKEDIEALKREVDHLNTELAKERAYSAGLEYSIRRRVVINIEKGG